MELEVCKAPLKSVGVHVLGNRTLLYFKKSNWSDCEFPLKVTSAIWTTLHELSGEPCLRDVNDV